MITIFNRKTVYIGCDLKRSSDIRTALADNRIPYTVSTKNHSGQWAGHGTIRGRTGSLGQSVDTMYEYEIYVHKSDYERAVQVIQNLKS